MKARSRIDRDLSGLDLNIRKPRKPDPLFDLERYFGLNGFKEHTASEIAALRGLSPAGSTNVPQLIRRYLSPRITPVLAAQVVSLRSRFPALKAQKRFEDLEADRKFILDVLTKADLSPQNPNAFCVERYFGLNGHRVHSLIAIAKQLNLTSEGGVIYRVHETLESLVGTTRAKRLLAVRERLLYYAARAIKAQAVRMQLAVARRISAVLETPLGGGACFIASPLRFQG